MPAVFWFDHDLRRCMCFVNLFIYLSDMRERWMEEYLRYFMLCWVVCATHANARMHARITCVCAHALLHTCMCMPSRVCVFLRAKKGCSFVEHYWGMHTLMRTRTTRATQSHLMFVRLRECACVRWRRWSWWWGDVR